MFQFTSCSNSTVAQSDITADMDYECQSQVRTPWPPSKVLKTNCASHGTIWLPRHLSLDSYGIQATHFLQCACKYIEKVPSKTSATSMGMPLSAKNIERPAASMLLLKTAVDQVVECCHPWSLFCLPSLRLNSESASRFSLLDDHSAKPRQMGRQRPAEHAPATLNHIMMSWHMAYTHWDPSFAHLDPITGPGIGLDLAPPWDLRDRKWKDHGMYMPWRHYEHPTDVNT